MIARSDWFEEHRHDLPYEIDGVVIKVDDLARARATRLHQSGPALGDRAQVSARRAHDAAARDRGLDRSHRAGHALRGARAGRRRGFDGVAWRRCTTRTRSRMKDVRPGDLVIVRKAGDVIPEVVSAVPEPGTRRAKQWTFPSTAPSAANPSYARRRERHVLRQPDLSGPAARTDRALRLARRARHRGPRRTARRAAARRPGSSVTSPTSSTLRVGRPRSARGFRRASRRRRWSRRSPAPRPRPQSGSWSALGIRHVGPVAARVLASAFATYAALASAPLEELEAVDGCRPDHRPGDLPRTVAKTENRERIARLAAAGFTLEEPAWTSALERDARRQEPSS